ncbi:type II toxin-antitoxin system HipA family toxin [Phenylobacterium sp.]|uniref:type II toxin-antitoxin system HipA family toxin n=1 Tax=Phenylobacterium sp. TaxID=1871053 RepID=UPI003566599F
MRLAPGTPLAVSLATDPAAPMPVARLAWDGGLAQLEWSPQVLARRLAVAALYYPPEPGLQAARGAAFGGLPGFLADSLPEGWGYLLMRKRLAKLGVDIATLSPLERLALVGQQGRGALAFSPATTPDEDVETLDLDALAGESRELLRGQESALADTLAGLAGGSGGARPKVHVGFDGQGRVSVGEGEAASGYAAWLVKFASPEDPVDIGPIEEAYARTAEAAGLRLSEHRLIPAKAGPGFFATRRFDRPDGGGRVHMVSLAGAIEAPSTLPSTSYDTFLRATQAITRHAGDVAEVFRRMVFNVLAVNRDDHTRQHAFLMDGKGEWRLSPAFDLTFSQGPGGEHYLDIAGEGRKPTRAHVLKVGAPHGLDARRANAVIEEVRAAVADWPRHAGAAGVSAASTISIGAAHARVWSDFG